mgnify:CR=1 FL=1
MSKETEYIKITPGMFINPPYVKCPKCGNNTFGVLMICPHHYCRRCANCYYPHPSRGEDETTYPLPELNKKIIYIDQFSISNMMKFLNPETKGHKRAGTDVFWGDLFQRLDTLCKLQLIICPDSDFHKHESLLAPYYKQLERMYELFSHGVSFYDYETVKLFQIMGQLKIWLGDARKIDLDVRKIMHGEINSWQDRFIISVSGYDSQALIEELRSNRKKAYEYMEGVFKRWQIEKDKDFEFWYNEENKSEAGVIVELYTRDLQNITKAYFGVAPLDIGILLPGFATRLVHGIKDRFKTKGVTGEDNLNKRLGEFLRSELFESTPYIKISSALYAAMAQRAAHHGRKNPPSRGFFTDVKIISTLLPYCDAIFVDNECGSLLSEKEVIGKTEHKTKIFSLSNKNEFLRYLDEIKTTASREHIKAVEEVYGVDWAKPYWEIFTHEIKE